MGFQVFGFSDISTLSYQLLGSNVKSTSVGCFSINSITNSLTLGNNGFYLFSSIYVTSGQAVTGVTWYQTVQGDYTATSSYNCIGLYSYSNGTLTRQATVTDDTLWKGTANTWQTKAFSSSALILPGLFYIVFLYNYSFQQTAPALGGNSIGLNDSPAGTAFDFSSSAKCSGVGTTSSKTSLPTSILTTELNGGSNYGVWFGLY